MSNPYDNPPSEEDIEQTMNEISAKQEAWDPLDLPESQAQLIRDLQAAGAPDAMIARGGAGVYHDYVSTLPMPKHQLVADAQAHDMPEIAHRAKRGDYDDSWGEDND